MTRYDKPVVCREILTSIAKGDSIVKACKPKHLPVPRAFSNWRKADPALERAFELASQASAWSYVARLLKIIDEQPRLTSKGFVDSGWVSHQKMRIDNLQWASARMDRKRFGERERIEIDVDAADPGLAIAFAAGAVKRGETSLEDGLDGATTVPDKRLYLGGGSPQDA